VPPDGSSPVCCSPGGSCCGGKCCPPGLPVCGLNGECTNIR
jgi:hypothetical protein